MSVPVDSGLVSGDWRIKGGPGWFGGPIKIENGGGSNARGLAGYQVMATWLGFRTPYWGQPLISSDTMLLTSSVSRGRYGISPQRFIKKLKKTKKTRVCHGQCGISPQRFTKESTKKNRKSSQTILQFYRSLNSKHRCRVFVLSLPCTCFESSRKKMSSIPWLHRFAVRMVCHTVLDYSSTFVMMYDVCR
jgi:hypothetical protein